MQKGWNTELGCFFFWLCWLFKVGPSAESGGFVVFRGCVDSVWFWECFMGSSERVMGRVCVCVYVGMCIFGDYGDGGVVAIIHLSTISLWLSALHQPFPLLPAKFANVKLLRQEGLSVQPENTEHPLRCFLSLFLCQWHMEKTLLSEATKRLEFDAPKHFLKATIYIPTLQAGTDHDRGQADCVPIRRPSSFNFHHMFCVKLGPYKVTVTPIRRGARIELYHSAGAEG